MWTDGRNIYVELPGDPPHILSYPYHESGLSKALSLLKVSADYSGPPQSTRQMRKQSPREAQAESILRKLGMVK
jgi:hypothetical protein